MIKKNMFIGFLVQIIPQLLNFFLLIISKLFFFVSLVLTKTKPILDSDKYKNSNTYIE